MTPALDDLQIERYSRQILLPEVGGRGQTRLLAGRVAVAGATEPARIAASLVARAGAGHLDLLGASGWRPADAGPDCRAREIAVAGAAEADVVIDLSGDHALTATLGRLAQANARPFILGTVRGTSATLATLVGRPCVVCLPRFASGAWDSSSADPLNAAWTLAVGALAANEALLALLARPTQGRLHTLDAGDATFSARPLAPAGRCTTCGAGA
jgi:hypothetical protein